MLDYYDLIAEFIFRMRLNITQKLFTPAQQIIFLRDFLNIYRHQSVPLQIVEYMQHNYSGQQQKVASSLYIELKNGRALAAGMHGWFDPILVEAVRFGEAQSTLVTSLNTVLNTYAKQSRGVIASLQGLIYPCMLLLVLIIAIVQTKNEFIGMALQVVKGDIARLSPEMRKLWYLGEWIENYWVWTIALLASLIFYLRWILQNYTGRARDTLDSWPIFCQYARYQGARFLQIYAVLKKVNVVEVAILDYALESAKPYYRQHLFNMKNRLLRGNENMAAMLNTGLIDTRHIERLQLLSRSGQYTDALQEISEFSFNKLLEEIKYLLSVFKIMLMFLLSYGILCIFSALMSINQVFT